MNVASATKPGRLTGEEFFRLPRREPCELVEGRIVRMSPTGSEHSFIEANLVFELKQFVRRNRVAWVLTGEVGIFTRRDPDTVRGADIALISKEKHPARPSRGFLQEVPELIVEIVSPHDDEKQLRTKVEEYFSAGVQWVWVVDPHDVSLTVYHGPEAFQKLHSDSLLTGEGPLEGFSIRISQLFEE